jgi:hypothetical protein
MLGLFFITNLRNILMAREKITFTGALGEKFCGRLDIPDDREPRAYILFLIVLMVQKMF